MTDMSLARQIKNLDSEMQPERDLWLGIERQIQDYPQKRKLTLPSDWMPYGIAASLLIAFSALMMNIVQLDKAESRFVSTDQSFDRMQSEYVQVRNPMVQKFWESQRTSSITRVPWNCRRVTAPLVISGPDRRKPAGVQTARRDVREAGACVRPR